MSRREAALGWPDKPRHTECPGCDHRPHAAPCLVDNLGADGIPASCGCRFGGQ